ncbi:MAG: SDR family oxidoreductase [Bacteroidetes bacterium]|nr:SDR family oxidoreductase [Bacteroidota bacterium]
MKIGVTGATGQLGRIVIEKLKEKIAADNIVALVRTPEKAAGLGVEVRKFDYDQPDTLADALKGIDKLLLISANEIGRRAAQHIHVIEAAKQAGVGQIVYTSLLRADTSTLGLAAEHVVTEKALAESGMPFVIMRHGWYTENNLGMLDQVVSHGVLLGAAGEGKTSSAARADYAEADALVLTSEGQSGKVYELAGDETYTMNDLASVLSEVSGKPVQYMNLPAGEYEAALVKAGLPGFVAQLYAGFHVSTEKGDLFDDGHQLSKLIGRPTTSLKTAITVTLSHK